MKKLLLTLAMVTALALGATTFAHAAEGKKEIVIGFSNRTLNGPYFQALTKHLEKFAAEAGYKLIATEARGDYTKQLSDCEDLLSQNITYLVLNPQDPDAGIKIAKDAAAKGVKVITIDSDISLDAPVVTRILPDNVGNNLAIGAYAAKVAGKTPMKVVLISGNQGNLVGQARSNNFFLGIIQAQLASLNHTNFQILSQLWGGWDQQGGLKAMEDALAAHPDLNTVYTENDDMALGAYKALRSAGKKDGEVKIYTYDGNKEAYKAIMEGKLMATGENNPEKMAKAAIEIIQKLEKGEGKFPERTIMPVLMVNKDNAAKVYNPDSLF